MNQKQNNMLENLLSLIKQNKTDKFIKLLKQYHKNDFDVNQTNEYGNTLLHIACRSRNYKIVETLIKYYDAKTDILNEDGRTALHIATIYGSTDITYYLSHNGKSTKSITNSTDIIGLIVEKSPYVLMIRDNDNMTPVEYFNIHSNLESNKIMNKYYKNYKNKMNFFDAVKADRINDPEDYKLTLSIYFSMKGSKYLS